MFDFDVITGPSSLTRPTKAEPLHTGGTAGEKRSAKGPSPRKPDGETAESGEAAIAARS